MRLVIGLGGNALLRRGEPPEAATQEARLAVVAPALSRIATAHQVVLVHGNGPQIGLLARESAEDSTLTVPYPLTSLGAATQGLIGSMVQRALHAAGHPRQIATLITHTVVDPADPAMQRPTKFIGATYDHRRAQQLARDYGWAVSRDGDGWRRVVGSPRPQQILELETGRILLDADVTVIMGGGGGIPVTAGTDIGFRAVEAVVDKDYTAALLAEALHADMLVLLTDVPGVITDYGTPDASVVAASPPALLRMLHLPDGSMGPKADAAATFTLATGRPAAIGSLEHAEDVVAGVLGTQIAAE